MTADEILEELRPLGKESYKRVLVKNHGVKEPCFGVAISELKKFQKRIKKDYQLALDLFDTGNYDAIYLAGLIADDARMTRQDLQHWVAKAYGGALTHTVASVAAGSPDGKEMALKWIESPKSLIGATGWATLSGIISITDDTELDLAEIKSLLKRVQENIHQAPDVVRYQMNNFVICVACYVAPLTEFAKQVGGAIGRVEVDMGNNDCGVPFAPDYIKKVEDRGTIGKKRRSAKC